MHPIQTCRVLLCLLAAGLLATAAAADKRPHIVYIVVDDLGWKDAGFQGATDLKTPNIDKLAGEGSRLQQFYVQPMCTPTRAALMTGRYPLRYGLQTVVIPSKGTYGLSTEEKLLPEQLKAAGYRTAMIGKWHLGHADRKYWPRQRGFDYFYGAVLGEIDYFTRLSHGELDWQRDNQAVEEPGYVTQLLGADAVRLIEADEGKAPLFLYLAFTAPHSPYQAPPEYVERFAHIADPTRRTYAGMIACLDDQIGKVVTALDRKGMRKDTLIVWHSDNGGTRDKMFVGEGKVATLPCDNSPLKAGKGTLYEGGTRVPAFVNWPGRVPVGTVTGMIHVVDMLPTLLAVAGAPASTGKPLDGIDVWPALSAGKPTGRDEIVYNVEPFFGGVRKGDWKLVWKAALPEKIELFHLGKDPNETTDLSAQEPGRVAELKARIQQLATESAKPLFLQASMGAVFSGLFGPFPIPTEQNSDTSEP